MTLENGGGDFDDYGIMDDYEYVMERLVATITDIYSDYSQGVFNRFGSEREYAFDESITASVALFEKISSNGGALTRASITICYDEQESDSDLTELRVDWIDMEEVGPAILAAIREDKLVELGL